MLEKLGGLENVFPDLARERERERERDSPLGTVRPMIRLLSRRIARLSEQAPSSNLAFLTIIITTIINNI